MVRSSRVAASVVVALCVLLLMCVVCSALPTSHVPSRGGGSSLVRRVGLTTMRHQQRTAAARVTGAVEGMGRPKKTTGTSTTVKTTTKKTKTTTKKSAAAKAPTAAKAPKQTKQKAATKKAAGTTLVAPPPTTAAASVTPKNSQATAASSGWDMTKIAPQSMGAKRLPDGSYPASPNYDYQRPYFSVITSEMIDSAGNLMPIPKFDMKVPKPKFDPYGPAMFGVTRYNTQGPEETVAKYLIDNAQTMQQYAAGVATAKKLQNANLASNAAIDAARKWQDDEMAKVNANKSLTPAEKVKEIMALSEEGRKRLEAAFALQKPRFQQRESTAGSLLEVGSEDQQVPPPPPPPVIRTGGGTTVTSAHQHGGGGGRDVLFSAEEIASFRAEANKPAPKVKFSNKFNGFVDRTCDWSALSPQVRMMGPCAGCWSTVLADLIQASYFRATGKTLPQLSAQYILDCVQTKYDWGCEGGSVMTAINAMVDFALKNKQLAAPIFTEAQYGWRYNDPSAASLQAGQCRNLSPSMAIPAVASWSWAIIPSPGFAHDESGDRALQAPDQFARDPEVLKAAAKEQADQQARYMALIPKDYHGDMAGWNKLMADIKKMQAQDLANASKANPGLDRMKQLDAVHGGWATRSLGAWGTPDYNVAYLRIGLTDSEAAQKEILLAKALNAYGPLAVMIDARGLPFYIGGILSDPKACRSDAQGANHAMLLTGLAKAPNGKQYWILKNSWGDDWGHDGYLFLERGKNMCGISNGVVKLDMAGDASDPISVEATLDYTNYIAGKPSNYKPRI